MLPARSRRLLRAAGHDVLRADADRPAASARTCSAPDVDLDLHIRDVVALLHYEDLRDVILVGHSYGGMVITGVADRAADRVGRLVYLDAANPVNGQSLVDVAGPIIEAARPIGEVVDGVELVLLPAPDAGLLLRRDRPRRPRVDGRAAHRPPVGSASSSRCELTERGRALGDPAVPHRVHVDARHPRTRELMAQARAAGRLWDIDTGHDLMITEPEAVADALLEVAARSKRGRRRQRPRKRSRLARSSGESNDSVLGRQREVDASRARRARGAG